MLGTHFKLEPLLRQHRKTPLALAEASGLSKTTVYNIVNNKAKAIELETLDKLMMGLEKLLGRPVGVADILEKRPSSKQAKLEQLLKDAKPYRREEVEKLLPPLTPEEKAENEEFMQILENMRKVDRQLSAERDHKLLELFEEPQAPSKKGRKKDLVSQ